MVLTMSHLFYADNILFMGEWDEKNITKLVTILNCFFLVSRLKINMLKFNLFGVGRASHEIEDYVVVAGRSTVNMLFSYLGLSLVTSISNVDNWKMVI